MGSEEFFAAWGEGCAPFGLLVFEFFLDEMVGRPRGWRGDLAPDFVGE
jgi:hypothetical protein